MKVAVGKGGPSMADGESTSLRVNNVVYTASGGKGARSNYGGAGGGLLGGATQTSTPNKGSCNCVLPTLANLYAKADVGMLKAWINAQNQSSCTIGNNIIYLYFFAQPKNAPPSSIFFTEFSNKDSNDRISDRIN